MKNLTLKLNLPFNTSLSIWFQKVDKVLGVNSRIGKREDDKHILLWDFDNNNINEIVEELKWIQEEYNLSDIFICADNKYKSYKAFCFKQFSFWEMIGILYDTDFIDKNFYRWTVRKGQATMRISRKDDRINLYLIHCIYSRYEKQPEIPKVLNFVKYETPMGEYLKLGKM